MVARSGANDKERYHRYLCSREWGLLREQVRKRCGNVCERCHHFSMSHVHHLTYIRKYNERLEDLQGLCEGCHDFTHGKIDRDPILDVPIMLLGREIKTVYLAGRISNGQGDWRREIVPDWHVGSGKGSMYSNLDPDDIANGNDVACLPGGRTLVYAGPYWLDTLGGHGGGDGPHAVGKPEYEEHVGMTGASVNNPEQVIQFCCQCISEADLLFAWLDSRDCHGTLVEIGLALAMGKIIVVTAPEKDRELWFACAAAHYFIVAESAGKAWNKLWNRPPLIERVGSVSDPIQECESESDSGPVFNPNTGRWFDPDTGIEINPDTGLEIDPN